MKIKCEFCGSMMNDTESACPNCGAPNASVRRSSGDQPLTIAELKQWYERKGLPPEEVTRFFIGRDVREPKAFGIYLDEKTGNYIVYKNKASGERAVRYEGTDEAYAVNELFQRLKQEIVQQKMQGAKREGPKTPNASNASKASGESLKSIGAGVAGCLLSVVACVAGVVVLVIALGFFLMRNDPKGGYYTYENTNYYYSTRSYGDLNWFRYGADGWEGPLTLEQVPDTLETKKQGKPYYDQGQWDGTLACTDFSASVYGQDLKADMAVAAGYYRSGTLYYHLEGKYNEGWYRWGKQWSQADYSQLPGELQHPSLAKDRYLSETYTASMGAEDFLESLTYQDSQSSQTASKGYYRVGDRTYYHQGYYYDEDWYLYDDDTWSPVTQDILPEELRHPSQMEDFYYTSTWDPGTQTSDFADSEFYEQESSTDSDSGSDLQWDSGDSWDSGDTDWDSDW